MPSRKRLPRKCSARGLTSTGSRRMLKTTTPSCIEEIIWWERLRSPASSERYFSRSRMSCHCCTARSTTCSRSSGVNGLTRKSKAPCCVTSTAASTVARAETITTTVRPEKRRVMCSVTLNPSMPASSGPRGPRRRAPPPAAAGRSPRRAPCAPGSPRRSSTRRIPSRIPSSSSMTITRIASADGHAPEGRAAAGGNRQERPAGMPPGAAAGSAMARLAGEVLLDLSQQVLQRHRLGEHFVHLHPLPPGRGAGFEGEAHLAGRGGLHEDGDLPRPGSSRTFLQNTKPES